MVVVVASSVVLHLVQLPKKKEKEKKGKTRSNVPNAGASGGAAQQVQRLGRPLGVSPAAVH